MVSKKSQIFKFKSLSKKPSYPAPDKSEIRNLISFNEGQICHCRLPVGATSKAVKHKSIKEIWYCISGKGIIWQRKGLVEFEKEFKNRDSFTIPVGNSFQFKNIGNEPLYIIICTIPKWPGSDEAEEVQGNW